jgi:hypothetical protein
VFDPARYTEQFIREQGFTVADWQQVLPGAVAPHAWQAGPGPEEWQVQIGQGRLHLRWTVLPPRAIALVRLPRLQVDFRFTDVGTDDRVRFMRHFDLYTQRGGG